MASDFGDSSPRRALLAKALVGLDGPHIMGIVNATDDSFFEGSRSMDNEAVARGLAMWDNGATWVDVGGESTRPGAAPVDTETELNRVLPVIVGLRTARPNGLISIDTRHAVVARAALAAGADMVNDVSGLRDPAMVNLVLETGCAVCIMHMQGEPGTMQENPSYDDVVEEVGASLEAVKHELISRGHPKETDRRRPRDWIWENPSAQHRLAQGRARSPQERGLSPLGRLTQKHRGPFDRPNRSSATVARYAGTGSRGDERGR